MDVHVKLMRDMERASNALGSPGTQAARTRTATPPDRLPLAGHRLKRRCLAFRSCRIAAEMAGLARAFVSFSSTDITYYRVSEGNLDVDFASGDLKILYPGVALTLL